MTNSVNSAKDLDSILFDISPKIKELAGLCEANTGIDKELFVKHDVKRGLRDVNGKGVLAGLTNISDVCAKKIVNGEEVPCAGNLYYRGYNIKDLVRGFLDADHFGYEEIDQRAGCSYYDCSCTHCRPSREDMGENSHVYR